MHDAPAVSGIEGTRDLDSDAQSFRYGHRAAFDTGRQCFPFEMFHDQEGSPGVFTDIVQYADIGMIETGNSTRLAFKALPELGIIGQSAGKNFNRDSAVQTSVASAIYFTHSAGAQ
jgi:hypothetical protein